jgi:hypothetical protein
MLAIIPFVLPVDAISFIEKEMNIMSEEKKNNQASVRAGDLEDEVEAAPKGGGPTMEIKPAVQRPSDHTQEPINLEDNYPDITEQIRRFAEAELPSCPHCGSENTASVQVGMIGRAVTIAASTPKVKLVPSAKDKLGLYFCNECGKYFN